VPPTIDGAAEAIELAEELHDAVMEGEPGRARARTAAAALWDLRRRRADAWPLSGDATDALLADLGARLAAIHLAEREALDATRHAIAAR
jgi:hypothetical protein